MFERRQLITHSQNLKFLLGRLQLLNHLNFSSYEYFSHHPLLFLIRKSYNLRKKERKKKSPQAFPPLFIYNKKISFPFINDVLFSRYHPFNKDYRKMGRWKKKRKKNRRIKKKKWLISSMKNVCLKKISEI